MASNVTIQHSLGAGELSPSLYGRQDLNKWREGTSTSRNFFVDYRGGVLSRGGLAYVGTCKQPGTAAPPRDIPFQFNINQGYVLEFGDDYLRVKSDGAYITEAPITVSSVSSAALFTTSTNHGYSIGDWIYDIGNTGFSGLVWIVNTVPTLATFTVTDLFGNVISTATASTGGSVERIYTVVAPYAAVDLPYLKYTQSADVMTLTCVNTQTETEYPPYNLTRTANTNWVFTQETFSATIQPPTLLVATAQSSAPLSTWYSYVVTAIDSITGEESNPTNPIYIQNNDISLFAGSNFLSWKAPVVGTPGSYNIYTTTPSFGIPTSGGNIFGFVGTSLGTAFTDTNIQPDFSIVPPQHFDPFAQGSVLTVNMTAVGASFDPINTTCTITSGTGTGFIGFPVVSNEYVPSGPTFEIPVSFISGVYIQDPGQGYKTTDTMSFSCPGGPETGSTAFGFVQFTVQPTAGTNLMINGATIEFIAADTTTATQFYQVGLGESVQQTVENLAQFLNAYNAPTISANVQLATYTTGIVIMSGTTYYNLYVQYKTPGSDGNAFTLDAGSSGATISGSNLIDGGNSGSGATATFTVSPSSGTFPSVCSYFQQRRVFGASLNNPDTYWMSQPGLFNNMDSSIPVTDGDSITGTPWAQQVNGIQFLVSMPGGLVVLTGKGAWQVNGGSSAAITPSDQDATPQAYNGCNAVVPPVNINYDILYVQAKGAIVRDLAFNFFVNIYTGTDLTILSNHLFTGFQLLQSAYCEEPYKLVWFLRNDGILLCLTYLKEQEVYSWTRHDTNGLFVGICSVTEPPVDALYVITHRYVNGQWMYYSERMNNRIWLDVEDSFCVDAGLQYPMTFPNATLTASAATGTSVLFTANSSVFSSGQIGNVIRMGGGKATITSYTSGTQVIGDITQTITATIPNDPNNTPIPQTSGNWSISIPTINVSGLNHLEGLTVAILADGSVVPNQVVTNNSVTLPVVASSIVIGLPYTCQLQTLYIDQSNSPQTVQTKRKTISAVGVRVQFTRGIQVGADQIDASTQQNYATVPWTNMNEIKQWTKAITIGNGAPLYTGDWYKTVTAGWSERGQIAIQQTYPLPANILALVAYWSDGDNK